MVVPVFVFGQRLSDQEKEILRLQDQRSLGDGKLLAYLNDANPQLRFRALIALANIQDTSTAGAAASRLNDPDAKVRTAAAFALGQIGLRGMEDSLLTHLNQEKDLSTSARILEALGKIGDERALDQVVDETFAGKDSSLVPEQVMSIGRFALRGVKNERSIWFSFERLSNPDAEVRWKALFALWRSAPHGLIDVEIAKRESLLTVLAADPNVDVRVNLLTLLSRSRSDYAKDILEAGLTADRQKPNWEVQVQIVRTMAALSATNPELLNGMIDYLGSSNDHVKIVTLQALAGISRPLLEASADTATLREQLVNLAAAKIPSAESVRGESFVTLAKLFPDDFARKNYMMDKDLSVREKTKVIEALSNIPSGRSLSIIYFSLDDPNVRIAMAAWDFVRRFLTPSTLQRMRSEKQDWGDARSTLYRKTIVSLGRRDMAITHLVSNALADTAFFGLLRDGGYADSLCLSLNAAYSLLKSPDDVEAMQAGAAAMGSIKDPRFVPTLEKALNDPDKTVAVAAAGALHEITGTDYTSRIPKSTKPIYSDYDWSTLEALSMAARAVIQTNKGMITLELMKDDAPFTVLSFVKLVRKNFYNGLSFHRVVPNFVIQGGDPRGDGWGGPGYAIRSEFSLQSFERGAVGIASAGKDTEGCQFFITHVPAPHLDGRYTVFARVIEGQDVVDRIQIGDTIDRITVE